MTFSRHFFKRWREESNIYCKKISFKKIYLDAWGFLAGFSSLLMSLLFALNSVSFWDLLP